uniref:ankyrin repeat domain-containing protein 26-like n=1 Tax=Arvicanthis niloticus TaxID=61156 RepID=UPI001485E833|nr:ankyrin repeat domain-containing protein 26-like [Arvicanthis niloticus]
MKKFFGNWNPRRSSSGPSTSQRESFLGPDGQCWDAIVLHSFKKLKSYKAFGKIHKAASRGAVATILSRLMLGKNGVNDRDRNGRTMLHYACAHGHPVVASLLIRWNCDIDLRDSDNCTALIKATQYGQEGCALILLDHGADPNAKDNHGNTALNYAVWQNKTSMVNILLEHHADICIRSEDNFTPYTLALLRNNESLAKFLVDKRDQILKADELKRLKLGNLKIKVQPEPPTEDSEQPQVMLDGTSLKMKITVAIRVSENLNPNLANTSANKSQTEVPENLMNSVVHEAEKPNQRAAALGLQKQDGQTEEQPVPVEENQQDDG